MNKDSALVSQLKTLAAYHGWANALLLRQLEAVADEHYFAPAGLFFGSIHGTLNHLLLGDRSWYGRFAGAPEIFSSLAQEVEARRPELAQQLCVRSGLWLSLIENTPARVMAGTLHYTTTAGQPAATPWIGTLTHVFNHATHHRGQISAALTRYGYECPELDLIYFLRQA
ncbi:DinB family protein [Pollutimonas sp. H1-120]|uniref:DinB family protein n=1 Tax=Pollutimonas sp. H1-120 TaxID=3148824 RepID=UPI003B519877